MRKLIAVVLLLALALAACGEADDAVDSPDTTTADSPDTTAGDPATSGVGDDIRPADGVTPGAAMGPGITVGDAIAYDGDELVLVNGYLFVDADGNATLASAMAESLPPQPAGDTIGVEGLDLSEFEFSEEQGIRWTDDQVQILGAVDGGVLVHGDNASA